MLHKTISLKKSAVSELAKAMHINGEDLMSICFGFVLCDLFLNHLVVMESQVDVPKVQSAQEAIKCTLQIAEALHKCISVCFPQWWRCFNMPFIAKSAFYFLSRAISNLVNSLIILLWQLFKFFFLHNGLLIRVETPFSKRKKKTIPYSFECACLRGRHCLLCVWIINS